MPAPGLAHAPGYLWVAGRVHPQTRCQRSTCDHVLADHGETGCLICGTRRQRPDEPCPKFLLGRCGGQRLIVVTAPSGVVYSRCRACGELKTTTPDAVTV